MPALLRDYVARGKVYPVNREFSFPGHVRVREAASYATAAARIGRYQQVADALFHGRGAWLRKGQNRPAVASVLNAQEQAKVQALANDPRVLKELQRDVDAGTAARFDRRRPRGHDWRQALSRARNSAL